MHSTMMNTDSSDESAASNKPKSTLWPTLLSVAIACLGSLTLGYAAAYPSSALLELAELPGELAFEKGGAASELFVALLPIGAAFSSTFGGLVADRGGRKMLLLSSGVPNFVGWLLIVLSRYTLDAFKPVMLTGRFLIGFAIGWLTSGVPLYITEISDPRRRGLFGALFQVSIAIGLFISYAVGAIPKVTYTHSAVVGAGLVLVFMILILTLYESPRFLLCKGHDSEAKKVLCWLRQSTEIAEEEIAEIKQLSETSHKLSVKKTLKEFKKRHVYIPLVLCLVLIFFYQFSGINVIVFYAATLFQTAGIAQARETALYAVGAVQIIATVISSITVDLVGRKVLLVIGSVGMTLSSGALGTHFFITRPEFCNTQTANWSNGSEFLNTTAVSVVDCNPQFGPLAITSLVAFLFIFSIGWRTIPFIIMNELFPLRLRGLLGGISSTTLFIFLSIVSGFYQDFELAVGPYTAWWVFAFVSFIGIFFVLLFLPETKGKSLEEIQVHFMSRKDRIRLKKVRLQITNPLAVIDEQQRTHEISGKQSSV